MNVGSMNIDDQRTTTDLTFGKISMAITLQRIIRFTLCMHTDHTFSPNTKATVDAYAGDWTLTSQGRVTSRYFKEKE